MQPVERPIQLATNFTISVKIPSNRRAAGEKDTARFKVREMQPDELTPGNILAIVDNNIFTISPKGIIDVVVLEEEYIQRT